MEERGKKRFQIRISGGKSVPGKSKLDEIRPPFFFFPHSEHLEKVQPHNTNWEGKC